MFPRLDQLLFPAVVLGAMGCAPAVVPAPAHTGGVPSPKLAQVLIDQLPALRSGLSLGEWKRTHPSDRVTLYSPEGPESSYKDWCARAAATVMLDSISAAIRTVYFYPPPVPDPPVLPTAVSSEQLVDQCTLGFVWIEAGVRDPHRIAGVISDNIDALAEILGAEQKDARVTWAGAAAWRNTHFWRSDALSVVVASTDRAGWRQAAGVSGTRVLVIAAGRASNVDLDWASVVAGPSASLLEQQHYNATSLRRAIRLANADGELTEAMLSFVARFTPEFVYSHSFTEPERAELVDMLLRWMAGTADLPVARRAAALVAADLFMTHSRLDALGNDEQTLLRRRLEARGAEFTYAPLGSTYIYTRSWVKEALRLDPDGTAGELAFLLLMEDGFETNLCRDQCGLGFRAVIEQGEAFLHTRPHAPIAVDVHFMVARAYADIVALAGGGGWGYADSAEYVAEERSARAKAIEHYQAASARAGNSFRARTLMAHSLAAHGRSHPDQHGVLLHLRLITTGGAC